MKKILQLLLSLFIIHGLISCDPLEDRLNIGSAITESELQVSAVPVIVNGKKSNKVVLDNKSPVLSNWDYGTGISLRKSDTVLLVSTGKNEIIFTGLNANGTKINKTISVDVDELTFPVPLEWGYLTDGSEKEWVWDTDQPAVWGNGGYMASEGPAWWTLKESDIDGQAKNEGTGAKMVFSLRGAQLTKVKSNGETEKGTYSFDMTKIIKLDNGQVWAKGKLTTKGVTVLCGKSPNEGNSPVYEYDILMLDNNRMILCYGEAGVGPWGTAWFWVFKAR